MRASRMLAKRIFSGLIILVLGVLLIISGGWIFISGIGFILSFAVWEYINMYKAGSYNPNPIIPAILSFIIIIITALENPLITTLSYLLSIFTILIYSIITYKVNRKTAFVDIAIQLASLGFITFLGSFLIRIRFLENGLLWIIISIFPACAEDISAFLFGSLFGKHKLAPLLSPKKTIEGYISGLAASVCTGFFAGMIINGLQPAISTVSCVLISTIVGVFSPFGDLAKSIIKRGVGLKNTSEIIPGHGGILDRIDTWLWAAPIAYYLIKFLFI